MPEKCRLSDGIESYLAYRQGEGRSKNTIRNERMVLLRLLTVTGNIYVASLGDEHITRYLTHAGATRKGATLAVDYVALAGFCKWAIRSRHMNRFANPMEGRKPPKSMPRERQRIPMGKIPALLDAAPTARDRAVLALGIYLFIRAGEIVDLRIKDVNLDDGEIAMRVFKTRQLDRMPICAELDAEMRRWLTLYASEVGPLDPNWRLVPAFARSIPQPLSPSGQFVTVQRLNPAAKINNIQNIVQDALEAIGMPTRTEAGDSLMEGVHTLRRSGARARFDVLVDTGYDGALRIVQAMLHHASSTTTESYLGLELDRHKRNELTRGVPMFPSADNVIQLRQAAHG